YTEADLDDLMRLWNDPRVQPLGPQFKSTSAHRWRAPSIVRRRSMGELIGQVVLHVPERKNRNGTYGACLLPAFWNRGYGSEVTAFIVDYAFRWIGLQWLSLSVFASND
ncbi:acyl-CoA N-acyltransferase, partial [Boletus edulis BED1]